MWWLFPFGIIFLLFFVFFFGYFPGLPSSLGNRGLFGDSFGVLNSLFSGLGFAGLVVTLIVQQRQIKQQAFEFKEQINDAAARSYEAKVFRVFSLYQDSLSSVMITSEGRMAKGRDALQLTCENFLKRVRMEGSNSVPHDTQVRYRNGSCTAGDLDLLDYLYYRNFWHLNYSLSRQGRLIETFKTLLRQLECNAPAHVDVSQVRDIVMSQLTHVEISYFFFVSLGAKDESELRSLMLKSGVLRKAANIYKLQIHKFMYLEFWGHDLKKDKQTKSLPIGQNKANRIMARQHYFKSILASTSPQRTNPKED